MRIRCPKCGEKLKAPEGALGKNLRCPTCKFVFRLGEPHAEIPVADVIVESAPTTAVPPVRVPPAPSPLPTSDSAGEWKWLALRYGWLPLLILGLVIGGAMGMFDETPSQPPANQANPQANGFTPAPLGGPAVQIDRTQPPKKEGSPAKAIPGLLLIGSLVLFLYPRRHEPRKMKTAWLMWLFGAFGCVGLQRFYCRKYGTGVAFALTGGVFLIGGILDAFKIRRLVWEANLSLDEREALERQQAEQQKGASGSSGGGGSRLAAAIGIAYGIHKTNQMLEAERDKVKAIREQNEELKRLRG